MTNKTSLHKGSVLIDLIIALVLASLFIAMIARNTSLARQTFDRAKIRSDAMSTDGILFASSTLRSGLYGNEFYQNEIDLGLGTTSQTNFSFIEPRHNSQDVQISSNGLCSVSFTYGKVQSITPVLRKIHLPIDPNQNPTSLIVRNSIAYVSFDSALASDADLAMFDIRDDEALLLARINTGPGIIDFVLVGKYLYAVSPSQVGQVHIIEESGLDSLILKNRFKLPLPYATATPALGSAIAYANDLIFLGTQKWSGDEFNILDIRNRQTPEKKAGYEVGSKVNRIFAYLDRVYASASNEQQLLIFDIPSSSHSSDLPDDIQPMAIFSPDGWMRQEGRAISLFENRLKFGRTSGGFDLANEHEYFEFDTNSSTTFQNNQSQNQKGGVYDIVEDKLFTYFVSRENDKEFYVIRNEDREFIASTSERSIFTFSLPIIPERMTCYLDKIYILAKQAPFIYELNFKSNDQ